MCRSAASRCVTRHHCLMAYVHNMSVREIRQGHCLWITQMLRANSKYIEIERQNNNGHTCRMSVTHIMHRVIHRLVNLNTHRAVVAPECGGVNGCVFYAVRDSI